MKCDLFAHTFYSFPYITENQVLYFFAGLLLYDYEIERYS